MRPAGFDPALTESSRVSSNGGAWDDIHVEPPAVAVDPDAAPDRRDEVAYSGASGDLHAGQDPLERPERAPLPDLLRASDAPYTSGAQPFLLWHTVGYPYDLWPTSAYPDATADQPVVCNNAAGATRLRAGRLGRGRHPGLLTGVDVTRRSADRWLVYVGFDDEHVAAGRYLPLHTWCDARGDAEGTTTLNNLIR